MPLREEILAVDSEASLIAFMGQLATDLTDLPGRSIEEVTGRYRELLDEYPFLRYLLELIVKVNENLSHEPPSMRRARIHGAGLVLTGIKAAANNQVFEGLEPPPDLE